MSLSQLLTRSILIITLVESKQFRYIKTPTTSELFSSKRTTKDH